MATETKPTEIEDIRAKMEAAVWDAYYLANRMSKLMARMLREEVRNDN